MNKTIAFHCDCCGLIVDPEVTEDCPRCYYPVKTEKEERFLQSSIHDLQIVSAYGGGRLKVDELIHRYQSRLYTLRKYKASLLSPVLVATEEQAPVVAVVATPSIPKVPGEVKVASSPVFQHKPLPEEPVVTSSPIPPQPPRHVFSWGEFFADQAINIVASVGAFLLLIGSLSFTITTSNLLVAFLVLFVVHAIFGVTGFVSYRFQTFRFVANVYSVIFALLVPLVAFALYKLLIDSNMPFSVPVLVAIAATYAAVIYILMATYQRFIPFAYLGLVALLVADLAVADALKLNYWWWPSMAMMLTLPATVSLKRGGEDKLSFKGLWKILRGPTRYVMYFFVAVCLLSLSYMVVFSLVIDFYGSSNSELRFSIVSLTLLMLLWSTLSIWQAKLIQLVIVLAFLVLASVMALCYALRFEAIEYALAFTCVELFYHGLNRFAGQRIEPFGILGLGLDVIALVLALAVPFISSPLLPLQLYVSAFSTPINPMSLIYLTSWRTIPELVAVGFAALLTLSVTFFKAGRAKSPSKPAWCWLLLLGGFLLNWEYSLIVLTFNITPVWAFLGLTLLFVAGAVIVRRLYSSAWANPLDVLAFLEIILTLSLSLNQNQDVISTLLLFFATLLYTVVVNQNRRNLLFLPLIFALLALPTLLNRPLVLLLLGIFLPFASVAIHHFVTTSRKATQIRQFTAETFMRMWEWPLQAVGLVYGIAVSALNYSNGISAIQYTFAIHIPIALEIAFLGVTWYAASALARVKWWLIPSVGFAIGALLIPTNSFWVLLFLTPVLALIGVAVGRFADRVWSLPYYIVAVSAAVMTGYAGFAQDHLLVASWALLGFAALAYIIGVIEKNEMAVWIVPAFVVWSVIYSTGFLGDQYRLPIVALVCAALGVSVKYFRLEPIPFFGIMPKNKFLSYALPFYATAFIAALLTGAYGMVGNINSPFYGAVPDALLIYALVAFVVLLFERQPDWLLLVAGFAMWAVFLSRELTAYYVFGISITMALLGLTIGIISRRTILAPVKSKSPEPLKQFTWSWPWYITAAFAALCLGMWPSLPLQQPVIGFIGYCMLAFTIVAIVIMLVERIPELLVFPAGLAAATICLWGNPPLDLVPLMIAYSMLCLVVFASQFIWRIIPPVSLWVPSAIPHAVLGLGGQIIVVLSIIGQGGLTSNGGHEQLAYVGAGALLELALLLFWYGYLHTGIVASANVSLNETQKTNSALQHARVLQHRCYYMAGFLCSFVITWELYAFGYTRVDVLLLAPASYLLVVAPFVMRDHILAEGHWIGQIFALSGALLLLLPALWFSFSENNLLPTLVLIGESLALLLLGIATRVRIFILTSASLLLVGALRALFLSTPPSLALMLLGVMLVVIATALFFVRHRLKIAWTHWE